RRRRWRNAGEACQQDARRDEELCDAGLRPREFPLQEVALGSEVPNIVPEINEASLREVEVGMSSQRRVPGTAVQRTIAVLGSAVFFVVAPCTLAGFVPWSMTGWQLQPPLLGLELTRGLGAILILAGVLGLVDAFARFALQGLGTPAPIAPPRNLVVTGLYRYVRNPIFVAVVAIIL